MANFMQTTPRFLAALHRQPVDLPGLPRLPRHRSPGKLPRAPGPGRPDPGPAAQHHRGKDRGHRRDCAGGVINAGTRGRTGTRVAGKETADDIG